MKLNRKEMNNVGKYPERIIQFGEGNFLRAFVDWIIYNMNKKCDFNSGVVVVQPIEQGMVSKLNEQDGLYTLYLNGIKDGEVVSEHSIIDSIGRGINPYESYDEYINVARNPELRFVISNTTEAGITFDADDKFESRPQKTYPGKLTAFMYERFKAFHGAEDKGLIIIPCELIDKNGEKLKEAIVKFCDLWKLGEEFKNWVLSANIFCDSLVDRIVPGYPRDKMEVISKELGYEDNLVVEGEHFHLWVIQGPELVKNEFPAHKAELNVLFVKDLTPYKTRKVRILNGAHTTMVPVSYLYGIDTVKETIEHEVLGKFVQRALYEEIIPTLDLPKEELEYFAAAVLERFKNPFIKHYLMSISLNSMSKYETRVLPSMIEYYNRKKQLPKRLVFSLAALIEFYKGDRNGNKIAVSDNEDILDLYNKLWSNYDGSEAGIRKIVTGVLGYERNWKHDLNNIEGLTDMVAYYLGLIEKVGMKEALNEVMYSLENKSYMEKGEKMC